ncbi:MalY/PatB family protein [Microbacterium sp. No. 7]|uniref:MalY/PatB family protein n=1 Tax=Microbacterium sp. No. 7 TaxID=1714373 RepID=UPI0006D03A44|nr:MalY/PatB family protein [Microbacterium sp. No. 7]
MFQSTHAAPARTPFDEVVERRGSNSMKWSYDLLPPEAAAAEPLPMWVADMDVRAPEPVIEALHDAVAAGVFGYPAGAPSSYLRAISEWQARRHGWDVPHEWIVQTSGIIAALKTIVQAFTSPGDSVLIQPPVYAHFRDDVLLNGRHPVAAPLRREGDRYVFDPAVFEAAIRPDTTLFILSNPHNPTGNAWSEDELRTMGEICAHHGILVVADEIHQDLVLHPERRHVPFASLGTAYARGSITCTAPSKTFNLAGLQSANVFIPDARVRAAFARQYERNTFPLVNVLGMVAAEAAYAHGEPWLDGLLGHLRGNHERFADAVNSGIPGLHVLPADALYLAWMDCRGLGLAPAELERFLLTEARVWFDDGPKFGPEGHGYMRVNLGCPRSTVDEAIRRLASAVGAARPASR